MTHNDTAARRVIIAADVCTHHDLVTLLNKLASEMVPNIKVGLELYSADGPAAIRECHRRTHEVMLDLKLHDIPATVRAAACEESRFGVRFLTVHATGGVAMMRAACEGAREGHVDIISSPPAKVLAVTVLTSHAWEDLVQIGVIRDDLIGDPELLAQRRQERISELVVRYAQMAQEAGCSGVVCSPREIEAVRHACGPKFCIVTPGIRPTWAAPDDQARVMTPGDAIRAGADYLVIGRPITKPPSDIGTPAEALERIVQEIQQTEHELQTQQKEEHHDVG